MAQCNFTKQNKERCQGHAMNKSAFCFTHNPETKNERIFAVIRGGRSGKKNRSKLPTLELKNVRDISHLLATTINEVRTGNAELRVANCIGYLAGHLIRALETSELESRIAGLEEKLTKL